MPDIGSIHVVLFHTYNVYNSILKVSNFTRTTDEDNKQKQVFLT